MRHFLSQHRSYMFGIALLVLACASIANKAYFAASVKNILPANTTRGVLRYVPIGDSYTIGESVSPNMNFPEQLARKLAEDGTAVQVVANPSRTGFTTAQVLAVELPVLEASHPDAATLLIGVNDWVQGVSETEFRDRLSNILDRMLLILPNRKIIVITIPDFSITPTGKLYALGRDAKTGISRFNQIITEESSKRRLPVVDIYPLSQTLGVTGGHVAFDGLHPTRKAYAKWVELIYPTFKDVLIGSAK